MEDGAVGGFGSHVAPLPAKRGVVDCGLHLRAMVLPDSVIDQASPKAIYRVAGLDAARIEVKVLGRAVVGERRA